MQPTWGAFKVFFGGSANNKTVELVASGWSDDGKKTRLLRHVCIKNDHFTKTGSGQT